MTGSPSGYPSFLFVLISNAMNEATLQAVARELTETLTGQKFGRIFQLGKLRLAIDFRLRNDSYLFFSIEPSAPRIYFIQRRFKDLEKQSQNPNSLTMFLYKRLSNAVLKKITKDENERILRFSFEADDEIEGLKNYTLVVQLTGRSANLFLLDAQDFILESLRDNRGEGQEIASYFTPPLREKAFLKNDTEIFPQGDFTSLSESLDAHFRELEAERDFQQKVKSAEAKFRQEISKREKLKRKLAQDLENHGNAEKWKRCGDLLLANLATAVREENTVLVVDYFDDDTPTIEIEADENLSLTQAAEKFFKRYTKARNAHLEIEKRLAIVDSEIEIWKAKSDELAVAVSEKDLDFLNEISGTSPKDKTSKTKTKRAEIFRGARCFRSSDGFEILVGKASKDNDYLTFRIAKANDLWLHAADYGGSHVVVKTPNRAAEIPPQTLIEAAELAAFFSQAKNQPKAAVNYTLKKFVNKPKGAGAGLVSLSSFKTILVEPKVSLEKLINE
ncbi:MAG: Rqc2 family fibronectin-binding protein [Pyrinomonadaceae bacterium]